MEKGRSEYRILTGKPTKKRPSGSSRRRKEENIRMDIKEIHANTRNWVDSAQDRDYLRVFVNVALQVLELVSIHVLQLVIPLFLRWVMDLLALSPVIPPLAGNSGN
jgi:hypothetical protein